jgi:serine protease DegQ
VAARALIASLFAVVVVAGVAGCSDNKPSTEVQPASASRAEEDAAAWGAIPDIVEEVQPSIVAVLTNLGEGSGVIYDADGTIVTNNHVIQDATAIRVAFADGNRAPATLLATDPLTDLAVLQIAREGLPPATFRDDPPRVGELAIAVGNPLGFENTATAGIVSGLHRTIPGGGPSPSLVDLLQTDAAISPGNSGGALVDGSGQVMGINVAYIPPQAGAVSLGFSIPADTVTDVVDQLLATGEAKHVFLGVRPAPITQAIAEQFNLDVTEGVLVIDVVPGSPAATAGILPGDVISAIDGSPIRTVADFLVALREREPGDTVEITLIRGGGEVKVTAELGERAA